jgi:enamine deaminase RidA (YjgF/YER057c/UK114 family)
VSTPEQRLAELGIELPAAPPPAAAYVPFVQTGNLLFTAGQVASRNGTMVAEGHLGAEVDVQTGVECARQCAINVIAQIKAAVGDLSRVRRVVKLTVFVSCDPSFTQPHVVANGASELIGDVFGEVGKHARSAVGAPVLPLNAPVEVEAIVEID